MPHTPWATGILTALTAPPGASEQKGVSFCLPLWHFWGKITLVLPIKQHCNYERGGLAPGPNSRHNPHCPYTTPRDKWT